MKKTLRLTALVMAVAIIVCAFAGCGAKIDKLIVGKWSDSQNNATIEFKEDGTFQYESSNLNILGISVGTSVSGTASYNKDNKVLTLNNDSWGTLNLTEVEA